MVQVSEGFVSSNYYITNIFFNTLPHKKQQQKQQQQQQQQHQLYTPSPSFFLLTHVHVLLSKFELYNMDDTTRRADITGNCLEFLLISKRLQKTKKKRCITFFFVRFWVLLSISWMLRRHSTTSHSCNMVHSS